jgi:8-oxo-dGTP pyrophosphatase MutT (NUDIX family)
MRDDTSKDQSIGDGTDRSLDERIEELNPGAPTKPRPAAGVVLLRRGGKHASAGLEVLLGKRTSKARFMANVWVFPGGAVDRTAADPEPSEDDLRATALRELEEEVSVTLAGPEELVPFSRWITPVEVKIRFDTHFYLALAPPHAAPVPDGEEIVDLLWFSPREALRRHTDGELMLVFPTLKQLEALALFDTAEQALAITRSQTVEPILPRVVSGTEGVARVLLPGEAGYDKT